MMLFEFPTKQKVISHCYSCTSEERGKQPLDCFLFVLQRKPVESWFCFLSSAVKRRFFFLLEDRQTKIGFTESPFYFFLRYESDSGLNFGIFLCAT